MRYVKILTVLYVYKARSFRLLSPAKHCCAAIATRRVCLGAVLYSYLFDERRPKRVSQLIWLCGGGFCASPEEPFSCRNCCVMHGSA